MPDFDVTDTPELLEDERTFADDYADELSTEAEDEDYFRREQEPDSNETLGIRIGGSY